MKIPKFLRWLPGLTNSQVMELQVGELRWQGDLRPLVPYPSLMPSPTRPPQGDPQRGIDQSISEFDVDGGIVQ